MEKDKVYPILFKTLSEIKDTYQQLLKIAQEKKFNLDTYSTKRFLGKMDKLIERIQTYEKLLRETLKKISKLEENESVYQKIQYFFP